METLMITIEEAHVSPVTSDVTGQVNGGHMRLRATTLPTRRIESNHTKTCPILGAPSKLR
jgi:hypothetical protein